MAKNELRKIMNNVQSMSMVYDFEKHQIQAVTASRISTWLGDCHVRYIFVELFIKKKKYDSINKYFLFGCLNENT